MKDASGGTELVRDSGRSTCQRKAFLMATFKTLLLFSLISIPVCYMLDDHRVQSSVESTKNNLFKRFINRTVQVHRPPLYRRDPNHFSIQANLVYPRNYRFTLDDTEVCRSVIPFLVLVVPVAPSNWKARDAIRRTWGGETHVQGELIRTVFLLGYPSSGNVAVQQENVHKENQQYHDIIQSDFIDSYHNLTIKTMVIMEWLATRCSAVPYAMKIDSDMFLHVENLMRMLKTPGTPRTGYATGRLKTGSPVIREKDNQWYVPIENYPDPVFPMYAVGMGYVFSLDMPKRFVEGSKIIPPFYVEDAYLGVCMKTLGLKFTPPPQPKQFKLYLFEFDRCSLSTCITHILKTPDQLLTYWKELRKPGPRC